MRRTQFLSTGFRVPDRVVTNAELAAMMDTSDEWIRQRSGIVERRWVEAGEAGSDLGTGAAAMALERAGMEAEELDCVIVATLSPDHFFPGTGVFLQRKLGIRDVPCLDVRNQCSGFLYGLSIADAWIRTGRYERILLVGTEVHSTGLHRNDFGRDTAVLFGDGAGAAILAPAGPAAEAGGNGSGSAPERGILSVHIHADGRFAEKLWVEAPASKYDPLISHEHIDAGLTRPCMDGREVFRHAVARMPEAVREALDAEGLSIDEVDMLIAHQANLRILQMVQRALGLSNDRIYNNIQRYGNTTAASLPIALHECLEEGRLRPGDLLCLTAFGSGFTWGSALIRW
ncbi:3-oxoacyl-ACP synthase III family protein [Candidatus Palauibacter sp.]|uniref:3-oxoacyl-ACP synthase III family protein n=1 Tax=Candidatus Palauibacter sp. TaxID=3101350 RepID=UPI003B012858